MSGHAKIIGVGMHKTGTKSLANALRTLGYSVAGPFGVHDPYAPDLALKHGLEIISKHDAAQDNPWPFLFREIDAAYPGSKFILTHRDPDDWLDSVVRHFGGKSTPMREWIYGVGDPLGNESRYLEVYHRHNAEIEAYFRGRPDSFMKLEMRNGTGWSRLCEFLEKSEPSVSFPHANSAQQRKTSRKLTKRIARALSVR